MDKFPIGIGNTPLTPVRLTANGIEHLCLVKQEGANRFGSIKDRVAWGLVSEASRNRRLEGGHIIDASSGNYGVAIAGISYHLGFRATIVAPPKITLRNAEKIRGFGAELIITPGEYNVKAADMAQSVGATFLDQYNSSLNPEIHKHWTAPETFANHASLDSVFLAASTGGTAAGFCGYIHEHNLRTQVFVVDSLGSRAVQTVMLSAVELRIPGFGSGRPSAFSAGLGGAAVIRVADECAFQMYNELVGCAFPEIGLSSCGVLVGALEYLATATTPKSLVLISADGGGGYSHEVKSFRSNNERSGNFLSPQITEMVHGAARV